ncbi:hypothetical protein ACTTAK_18170 (plasmid) [Rhodobacter capsulatus]|uniref:hypothetical protein n=1 Tax=Rhodobacter capsulatus TaxID=1061 RepID=UPI0011433965|nr:hypothetical protein [Rhodobacter capsulatus]TQD33314.1 hypothetical protein FKW81_15075 [Rhodobacter capsulatus]
MPGPDDHAARFHKVKPAAMTTFERIDAAAREIIAEQNRKRADLTLRLRLARLARDAAAKPAKLPRNPP